MARKVNNTAPLDPVRLTELWNDPSIASDEMCRLLNASFTKVRKSAIALGLHSNRMGCNTGRRPEDPTPEEIEARCLAIREGWTPEEYAARSGRIPKALSLVYGGAY